MRRWSVVIAIAIAAAACAPRSPEPSRLRNLLLITIDTLRADRVGAYGYSRARTPRLDALASSGIRFDRAYAAAPITLPSHATILSGQYPPRHGSRDNGVKVSDKTPTLATELKARGFRTAAFVAAFPLDHQFGLARGFDVYSDRMPRDEAGRQANERPAAAVVTEAIAWLGVSGSQHPAPSSQPAARFFLWIHLFEPHAPYEGDLARPVADRYDDEIATVDREVGRLLDALGDRRNDTLIVVAGDHGEAFGEHGEYSHSIFVYDTTLWVPLLVAAAGTRPNAIATAATLADVAPTAMKLLGFELKDVDGLDLSRALSGEAIPERELYAESFAPLLQFGWAPLRSVRSGNWKYIAAPKPELFDLAHDASEQQSVFDAKPDVAHTLESRVSRYSSDSAGATALGGPGGNEAAQRLRSLGYSSGSGIRNPQSAIRNDPKDRKAVAAQIAQVTSGELQGAALVSALEGIVREDPRNGQAHLRLGYARVQAGDCARAEPEFHAAIATGLPSADAYLGLAGCLGARREFAGAERALSDALRLEPDNPVIHANIGILKGSRGDTTGAIQSLTRALTADPNLHEARFNLALTYARAGRTADAARTAEDLLNRLPPNAPQRSEIERLLRALNTK